MNSNGVRNPYWPLKINIYSDVWEPACTYIPVSQFLIRYECMLACWCKRFWFMFATNKFSPYCSMMYKFHNGYQLGKYNSQFRFFLKNPRVRGKSWTITREREKGEMDFFHLFWAFWPKIFGNKNKIKHKNHLFVPFSGPILWYT